jgi:outer membrane protein assembly factor BamA
LLTLAQMTKKSGTINAALLLICSLPLLAQKRVTPQAIRFQGAPQYTQQELLAAAGLKPGIRLNSGELKARAKQLADTGLFKEVKFASERKTVLFTLTPSNQLFPMRLENVPLVPGKELDAKLHERFPLYRGVVPASGSMVEGICRTFEEMLAAKGAKATVKAELTSGLGRQKLTAVNFTVVSPAVHIGRIQLSGVSPAMQARASQLASQQTGVSFDTENTANGLQRVFEDLYHDQGYAAAQVSVAQLDPLSVSSQSIDVPYAVTIKEGGIYKLGKIELPADALATRAEIEKTVSKKPAGSGRQLDLFVLAVCDAYSARGYLDCSTVLHPSFDEAAHIVNYRLQIDPGPQYRFASVKFEGAPDAMAAKLKLLWKMAPGDVFDESYLANFAALAKKRDKSLSKWMQTVITRYDFKPDPATHEVNCIFHFSKAAQEPR